MSNYFFKATTYGGTTYTSTTYSSTTYDCTTSNFTTFSCVYFCNTKNIFFIPQINHTKARLLPHLSSKVVLSKNNKRTENENNKRKNKIFRLTKRTKKF